ncbi:MAG: sulfur carrier protein ThiS [Lentisphaerales bacterium]|nr:MAG: sulfur carrier protein ThiS [Lentisphaerales bacterium]
MKLAVNGCSYDYEGPCTIGALLEDMHADSARVAVVLNGDIIRRQDIATCPVKEGDTVEVVTFAGGG